MPIVPSRSREIQKLLARLGGNDLAQAESAMARLTLLGERAVGPLLAWLRTAGPRGRIDALAVLERLGDPRALPEILVLAKNPDPAVAGRALEAAAEFPQARTALALAERLGSGPPAIRAAALESLAALYEAGVVEAHDPLLDVLLEVAEDDALRLRCVEAVSQLPPRQLRPLLERLRPGASPALAERLARLDPAPGGPGGAPPRAVARLVERLAKAPAAEEERLLSGIASSGLAAAEAVIEALVESRGEPLPALRLGRALGRFDARVVEPIHRALAEIDSPLVIRVLAEALAHHRQPSSIPALHEVLKRLATRRDSRPAATAVAETRARIHVALAALGSRIALYDLGEMLDARPMTALPTLLKAAVQIGDATLLPALARLVSEDASRLEACAEVFAAIAGRERLRRTSRAVRSVRTEHRPALEALWKRARALRARP